MRSHRGGWFCSWVLGAILVVAPSVATTVRAQPGFGPDPFWPYNNQYTPYTTAVGPASPDGGGPGGAITGREGFSSANQFQQYLDSMSGPGRNLSDRSGVGMPYYRGSVDPTRDREYRPNAGANEAFEKKHQEVTEKYFDYFTEKDPIKRAKLLKEYRRARREESRALNVRTPPPSRVLNEAARDRAGSRAPRATRDELLAAVTLPYEPGMMSSNSTPPSTRPGSAGSSTERERTLRPAPPMPAIAPSPRPGVGRPRSSPTRVLQRAQGMDDRNDRGSGSIPAIPRGRRASPLETPPE